MQKVSILHRLEDIENTSKEQILQMVSESQLEGFEGFGAFDILGFNWYDIHDQSKETYRLLMYIDANDLIIYCQDAKAYRYCQEVVEQLQLEDDPTNERVFYRFFMRLLRGDMQYLENMEAHINADMMTLLNGQLEGALDNITVTRQELIRLKHYYEQLNTVFDDILIDDHDFFSEEAMKRISILDTRTDRYINKVQDLQVLISQTQDTYQAQLSIQQNDLMKIFTIETSIFLPLTLIVGWYGMNFENMPELTWKYGYLAVIICCIAMVVGMIGYFKHKKWL